MVRAAKTTMNVITKVVNAGDASMLPMLPTSDGAGAAFGAAVGGG
jgi:hypothetical protein